MSGVPTQSSHPQRTFLGHPVGLYVLFFTEMWERFSYYGMRGLLTLYLINHFKWTQKEASTVYKWYTGLVYLTPLLGGFLADRYLGNKRAVIIGAALMAVGHFLMAFEPLTIFYSALIFLIFGNGFFKPNMSTQVGRLYPANDPRRDGAYTIFYMGINLGAFLAPLACGWLAENTVGEYHSGFTLAGIGMVLGLLIYVFGQPWVREVDHSVEGSGATAGAGNENGPITEAVAARTPSALPRLARLAPTLAVVAGLTTAVLAPGLALLKIIAWNNAAALGIAAGALFVSAWILSQLQMAIRDRVLAIFTLGIFVVFFWAAFEQAGNVQNVWADKITVRHLFGPSKAPLIFPEIKEKDDPEDEADNAAEPVGTWDRLSTMFRLKPSKSAEESEEAKETDQPKEKTKGFVIPTAWFQSINALAIFVLAPVFAWLWVKLQRGGQNPSIPTKMALGLIFMGLSLAVMVASARVEDQPTATEMQGGKLAAGVVVNDAKQLCAEPEKGKPVEPFHAGRLTYDAALKSVNVLGVFPDTERDRVVRVTAPMDFRHRVQALEAASATAEAKAEPKLVKVKLPPAKDLQSDPLTWFPSARPQYDEEKNELTLTVKLPLTLQLGSIPPGYDHRYTGFRKKEVRFDPAEGTLKVNKQLAEKDTKSLLLAAGDAGLRTTMDTLMVESSRFRVSPWWLVWSYILATLGELCLSPVGLSMVSKLAPAKFATMLMGLWLLTSFFGNFVAGMFGELYESVPPSEFFSYFVVILGAASLVLFVLVRKIVAMMHGVK